MFYRSSSTGGVSTGGGGGGVGSTTGVGSGTGVVSTGTGSLGVFVSAEESAVADVSSFFFSRSFKNDANSSWTASLLPLSPASLAFKSASSSSGES